MNYSPKHITYDEACERILNKPESKNWSAEYLEGYIEGYMIGFDEGYEIGVREAHEEMLSNFEKRLTPHSICRLDVVYKDEEVPNIPHEHP